MLFFVTLLLYWLRVVNLQDESWFLWITQRMRQGDVPYRDFFLGVLPLPIWATFFASHIVGVHLFAIRLVNAFAFAVTVVLACFVFAHIYGRKQFPKWFAVANLLIAMPPPSAPYEPLAYMFVMANLASIVTGQNSLGEPKRARLWLSLSGLSCGLAFACKHNLGAYSFATAIAIVFLSPLELKRKIEISFSVAITFGLTVAIFLLPILLTGSWNPFWDYVFANKVNYLHHAQVPFTKNLADLVKWFSVLFSQPSHEAIRHVLQLQSAWLPVLAFITLPVIFAKRNRLGQHLALAISFHVSLAIIALYPHAGRSHILHAVPFYILGIACAAFCLRNEVWFEPIWKLRHVAKWLMLAMLVFTVAFLFIRVQKGTLQPINLPHFNGMLVRSRDLPQILSDVENLKSYQRQNEPVFLMFPKAGFFYLTVGLKNPTPYDIPSPTSVGLRGEEKIIAAIKRKEIKAVIMPEEGIGLKKVEVFVRSQMVASKKLNIGTMYELTERKRVLR